MEFKINIDLEMDIYKDKGFASLRMQGKEISNYIFKNYAINKEESKVIFYNDFDFEMELSTVRCEIVRVWQS